jgi:PilZ domain
MAQNKPLATGADWTQLLADPDLVAHLGKLLKVCREATPENREKALFEAIREIKQSAAPKPAAKAAAAGATPEAATPAPLPVDTTPPFEPDLFTPTWAEDRRRHPRMRCHVAVELRMEGEDAPLWGNLSNTSMGGCQIETAAVVPPGKKLEIGLWVANGKLWVKGIVLNAIVTGSKPTQGMRVRFGDMQPAERETLRQFLKFVENTTKSYQSDYGYLARLKR